MNFAVECKCKFTNTLFCKTCWQENIIIFFRQTEGEHFLKEYTLNRRQTFVSTACQTLSCTDPSVSVSYYACAPINVSSTPGHEHVIPAESPPKHLLPLVLTHARQMLSTCIFILKKKNCSPSDIVSFSSFLQDKLGTGSAKL